MNTIIKLIYDNAIGSLMDGFTEKIPIQLIKWSLRQFRMLEKYVIYI